MPQPAVKVSDRPCLRSDVPARPKREPAVVAVHSKIASMYGPAILQGDIESWIDVPCVPYAMTIVYTGNDWAGRPRTVGRMPGRWKIACRSSRGTKDSASFTEYATNSQEKQSTASERTQARCPALALAAVLAPERFAVEFVRVFTMTSCSGRRRPVRTWLSQPEMPV